MNIRDLIPWNRGRELTSRHGDVGNPFLTLHNEMNRLFDDVFRDFNLAPFGTSRGMSWPNVSWPNVNWPNANWPNVEISETDKELKVTAELPGLEEKDIQVELADGVLDIRGEKKTEVEDKDRLFSERFYGRFERRIPVEGIDEDKVNASFRNGVLTVTMPKSAKAQRNVKRIAINDGK